MQLKQNGSINLKNRKTKCTNDIMWSCFLKSKWCKMTNTQDSPSMVIDINIKRHYMLHHKRIKAEHGICRHHKNLRALLQKIFRVIGCQKHKKKTTANQHLNIITDTYFLRKLHSQGGSKYNYIHSHCTYHSDVTG